MTTSFFEPLEGRRFLCATAVTAAAHSHANPRAEVVQSKHNHAKPNPAALASITHYAGTATNQAGTKSSIKLLVVYLKGVREGILYVNDAVGNKMPIPFMLSKSLAFTFAFTVAGQKYTALGKLSTDGTTLSGTWTNPSGSSTGTFTASRT